VTTASKKTQSSETDASPAVIVDEVQARFDEAAEKGYFGHAPDATPNANYTLAGVTSGKPTPETERGK